MNERNEIKGDAIESIEAELLADAPEGETGFPEDFEPPCGKCQAKEHAADECPYD